MVVGIAFVVFAPAQIDRIRDLRDAQRAEEVGFNQHMVKPVDPGAVTALLASLPTAHGARRDGNGT